MKHSIKIFREYKGTYRSEVYKRDLIRMGTWLDNNEAEYEWWIEDVRTEKLYEPLNLHKDIHGHDVYFPDTLKFNDSEDAVAFSLVFIGSKKNG